MIRSTFIATLGTAVVVGTLAVSGAVAQLPEDCYPWPPVFGDCVTTRPGKVYCHYHFTVVDGMKCDTSGDPTCTPYPVCLPCENGLYCKSIDPEKAIRTYRCEDSNDPSDICFYCGALLACDAGYKYEDPLCVLAPVATYEEFATDGCRAQ